MNLQFSDNAHTAEYAKALAIHNTITSFLYAELLSNEFYGIRLQDYCLRGSLQAMSFRLIFKIDRTI